MPMTRRRTTLASLSLLQRKEFCEMASNAQPQTHSPAPSRPAPAPDAVNSSRSAIAAGIIAAGAKRRGEPIPTAAASTPSRAIAPDVDANPATTAAAIIAAGLKRRGESTT
jgi:hypothetical protein